MRLQHRRKDDVLAIPTEAIIDSGTRKIAFVAVGTDELLLSGTKWGGIGEVMAIMALFYGCGALVGPLQEMGAFSSRPQSQMTANAIALAAAAIVIWGFGSLSPAVLAVIGLISLGRLLLHLRLTWTAIGERRAVGVA